MKRIAIIDHEEHSLFLEDVDEEILQEKYNGEEEAYIKDNYDLSDNWSWDYITSIWYLPPEDDAMVWLNDKDFEIPE